MRTSIVTAAIASLWLFVPGTASAGSGSCQYSISSGSVDCVEWCAGLDPTCQGTCNGVSCSSIGDGSECHDAPPSIADLIDEADQTYGYALTLATGLPEITPEFCEQPQFMRDALQSTLGSMVATLQQALERLEELAGQLDGRDDDAAAYVRQHAVHVAQALLKLDKRIDALDCGPATAEAVECVRLGPGNYLCTCGCDTGGSCGRCQDLDSARDCTYQPQDMDYLCDSDHTPGPPPG